MKSIYTINLITFNWYIFNRQNIQDIYKLLKFYKDRELDINVCSYKSYFYQ